MLSDKDAAIIVKRYLPDGMIQKHIDYKGLFLFQVFTTSPGEEEMDPFFSVNKQTGEFRDFSIITDGNSADISKLFMAARKET